MHYLIMNYLLLYVILRLINNMLDRYLFDALLIENIGKFIRVVQGDMIGLGIVSRIYVFLCG